MCMKQIISSVTGSATLAETASMDAAIFCLALMGTDYPSFLKEATRVLKQEGRLWIAEVRSRFVYKQQEDFGSFIRSVESMGYQVLNKNSTNKMFVVFEFRKDQSAARGGSIDWPILRACLYKRR